LVLATLCLSLLIVSVDGTIVNVALPTLVRELGASSSQLQIVDAYTIIFASFLLLAGNTGDRLGRKGALLFGLVVFGAGSLASALAGSASVLILTPGIQGFGGAFIMPSTLSILTNVFPDPTSAPRPSASGPVWRGSAGRDGVPGAGRHRHRQPAPTRPSSTPCGRPASSRRPSLSAVRSSPTGSCPPMRPAPGWPPARATGSWSTPRTGSVPGPPAARPHRRDARVAG
jgi:hypothetical protein